MLRWVIPGDELATELELQVYLRNDMIMRAGELGREMFFIKAGAVQVCFYAPVHQIFVLHSSTHLEITINPVSSSKH